MPRSLRPLPEELFKRIVIDDDGAWWTGARTSGGYPAFRGRRAHRLIYEMFVGPIPDGLDIDHECHNRDPACPGGKCRHRLCMIPSHMVPRTRGENVKRGKTVEAAKARKAAQMVCKNGHLLELLPGKAGKRGCRQCRRERGRVTELRRYRLKTGIPLDAPLSRGRPRLSPPERP